MSGWLKGLVKKLARLLLGDYAPYFIYCLVPEQTASPQTQEQALDVRLVDDSVLELTESPVMREQAGYFGAESLGFGCFHEDRLVGLCFYWYGDRYRQQRNFLPLKDGEAKLVQIIVSPEARGRGVATALIERSAGEVVRQGFRTLYARIWHSNVPSLKAFERAGWRRIALVLEINPFRSARPIRFRKQLRSQDRCKSV